LALTALSALLTTLLPTLPSRLLLLLAGLVLPTLLLSTLLLSALLLARLLLAALVLIFVRHGELSLMRDDPA
jgi:hypothetical protein